MQIIEISEPGEDDNKKPDDIAVGIDFGTTNSLIAISSDFSPYTIKDKEGRDLIPSIVDYGEIQICSIKRLLGKGIKEIIDSKILMELTHNSLQESLNSSVTLKIIDRILTPIEIAAEIFIQLKINAETALQQKINKAVITIPAHFDDAARGGVLLAAKIAGFSVLRLLAEPTAAAYAYGLHKKVEGCYLVYDLGGGTFDISMLNISKGVLQVMATVGDNLLGGDDIDHLVGNYLQQIYRINDELARKIAKKAKEELSYSNIFSFTTELNIEITLDIESFEKIIFPLINKTIKMVKQIIFENDQEKLDGIILVGGSSRIPLISKLLNKNFTTVVLKDVDPDKVVALGAALQAENLTKTSSMLLIDVVPLSLGFATYGGIVEKLILRNSPIPISVTKEYTTYADNQNAIEFHILQGERELVEDCRSLAYFTIENLPLMPAGRARIEITFALDLDGILSVTALEKTSGMSQIVQIKPSYGINEQDIEHILTNAYKNVVSDHKARLLQEIIVEAESLINKVITLIDKKFADNIAQQEIFAIKLTMDNLQHHINQKDYQRIKENLQLLKEKCEQFRFDAANISINSLLKGKNINEI